MHEHIATPNTMTLFSRGSGQILVMGRLNVPLGVRRVITHTLPSFTGWVYEMTPVGHWSGVMLIGQGLLFVG